MRASIQQSSWSLIQNTPCKELELYSTLLHILKCISIGSGHKKNPQIFQKSEKSLLGMKETASCLVGAICSSKRRDALLVVEFRMASM